MSVFKTKGIVLQVGKYSEKELFYKIFFRDYGILTVKKKKKAREKPIDMGYLVSLEIITHSEKTIHTIGNIRIISFFNTAGRPYSEIESFMKLLSRLKREIPEGNPHYEVFDMMLLALESEEKLNIQRLLLIELKLIACLGNLGENDSDEVIQKILKFIHNSSYKDIFRLGAIPEKVQKKLEDFL